MNSDIMKIEQLKKADFFSALLQEKMTHILNNIFCKIIQKILKRTDKKNKKFLLIVQVPIIDIFLNALSLNFTNATIPELLCGLQRTPTKNNFGKYRTLFIFKQLLCYFLKAHIVRILKDFLNKKNKNKKRDKIRKIGKSLLKLLNFVNFIYKIW